MRKRNTRRARRIARGVVLLQVLVMSVVLALVSIGILRWVLSRYYLVTKHRKAMAASGEVEGCLNRFLSAYDGQIQGLANGQTYNCGGGVTVSVSGSSPGPFSISVTSSNSY